MKFYFLTLFPEVIEAYLKHGIVKRAVDNGLIETEVIDIKDNKIIGKINYIFNNGANDVYEVRTPENKMIYLPAIKQVIKKVDIKSKKVYVEMMEGLI